MKMLRVDIEMTFSQEVKVDTPAFDSSLDLGFFLWLAGKMDQFFDWHNLL